MKKSKEKQSTLGDLNDSLSSAKMDLDLMCESRNIPNLSDETKVDRVQRLP